MSQAIQIPPTPGKLPWWKEGWIREAITILAVAGVIFLVLTNTLQTVRVDGSSMENNLQNGNLLIASKISYDFGGNPARGDIVILVPPIASSSDFIKRVIGLPGDIIEINGQVKPTEVLIKPGGKGPFQVLKEPYLPEPMVTNNECCNPEGMASLVPTAYRIPAGDYFVMGDNRNDSMDSRSFGVVARKEILAKAILRFWPLNKLGGLGPGPTLATPVGVVSRAAAFPLLGLIGLVGWRRRLGKDQGRAGTSV